ncbi:MAG: LysR family transcriptional regulator [Hyphomicrobiaceae bacterium]
MDLPNLIVLFARVVDAGSFSAASRELNQSPSAVSKQISQLEDRVGVRLLVRSKNGVTLTDDGQAFYERCAEIRRSIAAAEDLVVSFGDHPKGLLHVSATVAFGKAQILPVLPAFMAEHADVTVSVHLSDSKLDFSHDQIDIAIQFTEQIEDQALIARKIAHNRRVICASPAYLEREGKPATPDDLQRHNRLQLSTVPRFNDWQLNEFEPQGPQQRSNFEANSADALYHATLAGIGIARLSTYLVANDLRDGRLIRVLPDYEDNTSDIYAVYSSRQNLAPKVRAFIDHLVAEFSPTPPWERDGSNYLSEVG